jgi:LysM repeat protein/lysophospholipase L1-like esterase
MLKNRWIAILFCFLLLNYCTAQTDTTRVQNDSVVIDVDTTEVLVGDNIITNSSALKLVFEKLYQLEKQKAGHVNIVHIGDSHIQADLFTDLVRKSLQQRFGNGGLGFTFPHNLARTNGGWNVRYNSNTSWDSRRVIYPAEDGMYVGLSGIALKSNDNFAIELNVKEDSYDFNTIKVLSPKNSGFDLATSSKTIVLESTVPKKITHKIKNGEVLGSIANKYDISVAELKKANGMKSDKIRAGKTLKIPTGQMQKKEVKRSEFIPLALQKDALTSYYHSNDALSKIYLLPDGNAKNYNLNGLVLENDGPGVIYHSIGVNGAKASDFNRFPLFFDQLPALKADLIVVSLGTNESFDKLTADEYMAQLNEFIGHIRAKNPDACLLIMTPPPSLFKRKYPNTFAASYAKNIAMTETQWSYATWDLYSEMGGLYSVSRNASRGLMSSDKVHYSKDGYEKQGRMFAEAFLKAYDNFKTNRE